MSQKVAVADHRRYAAQGFIGDRATGRGNVRAVQRKREVLFGELIDGEIDRG